MTSPAPDSEPVRTALADALTAVRPELLRLTATLSEMLPPSTRQATLSDRDTEQFLHAFEALMREALEESGEDKRRLIFETAVPAMLAQGQTIAELMRSHIAFFTILSQRLVAAVPEPLQEPATLWLARFFAVYVHDLLEAAGQAPEAR